MTRLLLDAKLANELKGAPESIELCDPTGEVVGHFTPVKKGKITVPFTEEEIYESKRKKGGRSLAEILTDLEKK
jgi:hypothetical protein